MGRKSSWSRQYLIAQLMMPCMLRNNDLRWIFEDRKIKIKNESRRQRKKHARHDMFRGLIIEDYLGNSTFSADGVEHEALPPFFDPPKFHRRFRMSLLRSRNSTTTSPIRPPDPRNFKEARMLRSYMDRQNQFWWRCSSEYWKTTKYWISKTSILTENWTFCCQN